MKGSFSVEVSMIFPLVFLIIVVLMQCGLYYSFMIYSQCIAKQGLLICITQRDLGEKPEEAIVKAENYMEEKLSGLPIKIKEVKTNRDISWFSEEYAVEIWAEYRLFTIFSWKIKQQTVWMNPVLFKNRADFLWEKAQQYLF